MAKHLLFSTNPDVKITIEAAACFQNRKVEGNNRELIVESKFISKCENFPKFSMRKEPDHQDIPWRIKPEPQVPANAFTGKEDKSSDHGGHYSSRKARSQNDKCAFLSILNAPPREQMPQATPVAASP